MLHSKACTCAEGAKQQTPESTPETETQGKIEPGTKRRGTESDMEQETETESVRNGNSGLRHRSPMHSQTLASCAHTLPCALPQRETRVQTRTEAQTRPTKTTDTDTATDTDTDTDVELPRDTWARLSCWSMHFSCCVGLSGQSLLQICVFPYASVCVCGCMRACIHVFTSCAAGLQDISHACE